MITRFYRRTKKWLARNYPKLFSTLYSTLDEPMVVPIQAAAYQLALEKYLSTGDSCLDVGFGLGYGLGILSSKAKHLTGIDVDKQAVANGQKLVNRVPNIKEIVQYDGKTIPFKDQEFDIITCIDVIEHVPDYLRLISEMARVSKQTVFIATPNRRPENTFPNGKPRNPWHIREWTYPELHAILTGIRNVQVEWNFLNGPWDGPFSVTAQPDDTTLALTPVLLKNT